MTAPGVHAKEQVIHYCDGASPTSATCRDQSMRKPFDPRSVIPIAPRHRGQHTGIARIRTLPLYLPRAVPLPSPWLAKWLRCRWANRDFVNGRFCIRQKRSERFGRRVDRFDTNGRRSPLLRTCTVTYTCIRRSPSTTSPNDGCRPLTASATNNPSSRLDGIAPMLPIDRNNHSIRSVSHIILPSQQAVAFIPKR